MKQLKFLMVALTLLMGISLTSCLGESDPTRGDLRPLKLVNTYPFTFQYPNDGMNEGLKVVATNSSELLASSEALNMRIGDIIYISYTYNSDEQTVTTQTKEVNAKVVFALTNNSSNLSANAESVVLDNAGTEEPYENATINAIGDPSNRGEMFYYDKNTIIIALAYLGEKDDYISKHRFTLVYDQNDENSKKDGVMNLYLRHYNSEEKPNQNVPSLKAFDIRHFIALYGETPTKIRIYANLTDKSGSCDLADAKKELQYKEIDYKSVFEK